MMRGSSSRGGRQAYRQLLQALEEKGRVFITPDGPRGPEYVVKEGSVKSAGGRVVNVLGEPIDAGAISEGKELEKMLRDAMNEAQKEADAWINREI